MTINDFSTVNEARCVEGFKHKLDDWSLSDWMTALTGEVGEAANIVKKMNRHRDGIDEKVPLEELKSMLRDECGDIYCYLSLFAKAAGFDIEEAAIEKFNEVSLKRDWPYRIEIVSTLTVDVEEFIS